MKFEKYPSLVRSEDISKGRLAKHLAHADDLWYATEKIHGANFAIYYDGIEYKFAKRTGFIEEGERFFRYEEYFTEEQMVLWKTQIQYLWDSTNYSQVIIYGEFFGGEIQRNVTYRQTVEDAKEFRVFNIFGRTGAQDYDVLGYRDMHAFFPITRMVAPFVAKGQLWDLLKTLDMEAESTFGGISEGYVLQQYSNRTWSSGDTFIGIKHKTHHFTEVSPEKMAGLIGRAAEFEDLKRYVTENRLDNLLSKGYFLVPETVGSMMELYLDDVFAEYVGDIAPDALMGYRNMLKKPIAHLLYTRINNP